MAFDGSQILLIGLCEIALPSRTVRLCDGGFLNWPARGLFKSQDDVYGTIESVEAITDSVGDEAPSGRMTMLPPDLVLASELFQPEAQGSPMLFWHGELNSAGQLLSEPELIFSGMVDTITITVGRSGRKVDVEFMSSAEKLFMTKEGNVLSPRFHKTVWPGELGLDHATGVQKAVPWGITGAPRGASSVGSGSGFGGNFGNLSVMQ